MLKLRLNHAPHDCRYTFAALADNSGMNETCRKLIMGHSLANREGTAFKTGGRRDVTMDVYTEKYLHNLKNPGNSAFPGSSHPVSAHALGQHRIGYLLKACNVRSCHIVAFHTITLCRIINVVIDIYHDLLQLRVHFFKGPA